MSILAACPPGVRLMLTRMAKSWSRKVLRWRRRMIRLQRREPERPELIDSTRQRLAPHAGLTPKPAYVYPGVEAPLLISIVIPCFNYGRFLPETVRSALQQTLGAEVIVVDDGSDDAETISALAALGAEKRVRIIRHETNLGLPSARNSGIAAARGEYICCLDADDTIETTYVEKCVALLRSDPSLGFVYSWVRSFGDSSSLWRTRDFDIEAALFENQTSVSALFRRDDWMICGGFDPSMRSGYEDWEFWLRLAQLGRRGRAVPEELLNHRRHGRTLLHEADQKRRQLMATIRNKNRRVFEDASWRGRIRTVAAAFVPDQPFSALAGPSRDETDARPHLLVMAPWLAIGGAEALLAEILNNLKTDWRLSIVTTEPGDQPLTPVFLAITPEVYHLPNFLDRRHWLEFVAALLASRGTSAILSSGSPFLYANLAEIKSRFRGLTSYDIVHNDAAEGHLASALDARSSIDHFIAVSESIGRSLVQSGARAEAVAVIPNGIDYAAVFNPQRIERDAARARYGIEDGSFVIGFAGRMSEEKNPLAFLAVAAPILAAHREARLLVVGDGPMTATFRRAARRAGVTDRLHYVPSLDRLAMPEFYAACSILVMVSRFEGTPLAMLEALAMGCPVAATDVGDVALMIREDVNGFIAPTSTPEALTPRIARLVADQAALTRMRIAARRSIVEAGRSADAMLSAYRALISQPLEHDTAPASRSPERPTLPS